MNCLILILLLSCCGGWGNGCCVKNDCRTDMDCCARRERNSSERRNRPEEPCGRMPDRKPDDCGCAEERSGRGKDDCGCEHGEKESCDIGMIPPPWQEYPRFPHHGDNEECES